MLRVLRRLGSTKRSVIGLYAGRSVRVQMFSIQTEALKQQLQMFPEYPTATEYESSGNFAKALPLYQRMHEVISGAMGPGSHLATELVFSSASLHRNNGEFDKAIKLLEDSLPKMTTKHTKVRAFQQIAVCNLMKGDTGNAVTAAERAVEFCEAHEDSISAAEQHDELALFSPSYSVLGISSLFHGDLDTAETYLQLAARWAQPEQTEMQISALSNLGTFSMYKLGTEGYECAEPHACLNIGLPALRRQTTTTAASVSRKVILEHPLVREAVAYWQGALDVVNSATSGTAGGAAAMCGVPANAPISDMTGLGSKARMVTSSTSSTDDSNSARGSTETKKQEVPGSKENLLQESGCLKAYVSVLCNFAELYECTGELTHKEEYISSALAALQGYKSTDNHAQLAHRPLLGRVLSLAAHRELSVGQAVSAEGLYRSAIDHLSSPLALHDPRYKYEKGIAQGGYGLLLTRWDKRASAGEELLAQSAALLQTVPSVRLAQGSELNEHKGVVVPLSGMLQLPV